MAEATDAPVEPAAAAHRAAPRRPGWVRMISQFARRRTLGFAGGMVVVLMILLAVLAPVLAPYDPLETSFLDQLKPPSSEHWLGTDTFGRDVFSRLVYGAQTALLVGFVASIVGCSAGAVLGLNGAYFGGNIDLLLERLNDILLS